MIHQYKLNGYNIVLDVYSGSVHVVDEVAYDMIALYETTPPGGHRRPDAGQVRPPGGRGRGGDFGLPGGHRRPEGRREALLPGPVEGRGAGGLRPHQARAEGAVPPRGPHLQPQLLVLLRQPGALPRGPGPDALRGGQAGPGLFDRQLRLPGEPGGGLLRGSP